MVLFHSLQSVMTFGGLMIAHVLTGFVPLIGPLVASLLSMLTLILWIVLVVQAAQGRWFKLPWIGDIAERQLRNL
ncbi:putative membrane protein [Paenibacillus sp. DS2015]